jgi:ribonuclease BN (tRNA processing enzyme)
MSALNMVKDSDILVHECTNASFPGSVIGEKALDRQLAYRGHSSPLMAGRFAKAANVKKLVLNHFSQKIVLKKQFDFIQKRASDASGLSMSNVIIAKDGDTLFVGGGI